jgi:subtilisin family serine protease
LLTVVAAVVLAFSGAVLAQQTTPGSSRGGAPPETPKDKIPDRYIVVLDDEAPDPGEVARQHANEHGLQAGFVYRHAIKGYSATIPNEQALQRVRNEDEVKYVEQDGVVNAVAQTLPWGIDKIEADASSTKAGNGAGSVSNVNAYIIDSGVGTHGDLNKVNHVNFAGGKNADCNGHGTHVAGTVAAKDNTSDVVGVVPGAPLTGVKVLGCSGSGSWSGVIKGIDWVTANAKKPAVANMSLGGGTSQAVDDAVRNSANSGIFYALAASNDGADACKSSPARAGAGTNNGIMTVAATDKEDKETSWSNYGSCVEIWAPGASILSTKRGGGTTTMSGTSMASPHGAGGGGLYLSTHASTTDMKTVEAAVKSAATTTTKKSKDGKTIVRESVGGF